jgi:hypothetical protein
MAPMGIFCVLTEQRIDYLQLFTFLQKRPTITGNIIKKEIGQGFQAIICARFFSPCHSCKKTFWVTYFGRYIAFRTPAHFASAQME